MFYQIPCPLYTQILSFWTHFLMYLYLDSILQPQYNILFNSITAVITVDYLFDSCLLVSWQSNSNNSAFYFCINKWQYQSNLARLGGSPKRRYVESMKKKALESHIIKIKDTAWRARGLIVSAPSSHSIVTLCKFNHV